MVTRASASRLTPPRPVEPDRKPKTHVGLLVTNDSDVQTTENNSFGKAEAFRRVNVCIYARLLGVSSSEREISLKISKLGVGSSGWELAVTPYLKS